MRNKILQDEPRKRKNKLPVILEQIYPSSYSQLSKYSWLPITWTFKGNQKRFELSGVRVIGGAGFLLIPLITCILAGRTGMSCVQYQITRRLKKFTQTTIRHFKIQCFSIFRKLIQNKFSVLENVLSHYTLTNEVRVIIKEITWREQDFSSSKRGVRDIEGSSYWG